MTACACGCGEAVTPGRTWRKGHSSRARPRTSPPYQARFERCPHCNQRVALRTDGSFGRHWLNRGRKEPQLRCPAGGTPRINVAASAGRRVTVVVDVVIPHGWSLDDYRLEAARVLRKQAVEGFVVALAVADVEEAS